MRVFLDVETTAITNLLPDRIFLIVCKDDKQITYFKEDELDKFSSYIDRYDDVDRVDEELNSKHCLP